MNMLLAGHATRPGLLCPPHFKGCPYEIRERAELVVSRKDWKDYQGDEPEHQSDFYSVRLPLYGARYRAHGRPAASTRPGQVFDPHRSEQEAVSRTPVKRHFHRICRDTRRVPSNVKRPGLTDDLVEHARLLVNGNSLDVSAALYVASCLILLDEIDGQVLCRALRVTTAGHHRVGVVHVLHGKDLITRAPNSTGDRT